MTLKGEARTRYMREYMRRKRAKEAGLTARVKPLELAKAAVPSAERKSLTEKLEPLIESLFTEGTKNMVTMSPGTVIAATVKLERLLVEHGIMPVGRRYENPQAYARAIRERATRQRRRD